MFSSAFQIQQKLYFPVGNTKCIKVIGGKLSWEHKRSFQGVSTVALLSTVVLPCVTVTHDSAGQETERAGSSPSSGEMKMLNVKMHMHAYSKTTVPYRCSYQSEDK